MRNVYFNPRAATDAFIWCPQHSFGCQNGSVAADQKLTEEGGGRGYIPFHFLRNDCFLDRLFQPNSRNIRAVSADCFDFKEE